MTELSVPTPLTAIVYTDGQTVELLLQCIAHHLKEQGIRVTGFVQHNEPRTDRDRCDMILEDLESGSHVVISEDRGSLARGCMLNIQELLRAEALGARALENGADLLIVNKFGKTETEGGGFRSLISDAAVRQIPVLIAVPASRLAAWHFFSEGLAAEYSFDSLPSSLEAICRVIGLEPAVAPRDASKIAALPADGATATKVGLRCDTELQHVRQK